MKHNDWTDKLHDRLSDYKAEPPVGLWDKIETSLDSREKKAKIVRMRVWTAAAAAVLLLITGVGYLLNKKTISQLDSMEKSYASVRDNAAGRTAGMLKTTADVPSEAIRTDRMPEMLSANSAKSTLTGTVSDISKPEAVVPEAQQPEDNETKIAENTAGSEEEIRIEKNDKENPDRHDVSVDELFPQTDSYGSYNRRKRGGGWAVSAYSSNMFGNVNSVNGVNVISRVTAKYAMTENMLKASSTTFSNYKEDKKHYLPVSFGLTAAYAITDRISLTSGVVYSKLSSDFIRSSNGEESKDCQTLHYVGVPLNVNYNVWSTGRFKAYVTAGGQADFNVSARVETEGVKRKMDRDDVQWSVNAAAGAQYDVIPQLGVYVEPGVKYYIDNGSAIENYFKDKPVSFSLQVGLRLNIK